MLRFIESFAMAFLAVAILALTSLMAGCQQSPQVGRPTVYQLQIMPASSENARPVNAERAEGESGDSAEIRPLARTLYWRDNTIRIDITTAGGQGAQEQQPTQDVSPETDLDVTP